MTNILIDSDKKLHNLLSKIEDCKEIGLDTEFIRESTYTNTCINSNFSSK